ncbi:uncharacterized protein BO97DRAFT_454021, partial [Aspergillus homomorphus CBS 101889]
SADREKHNRVFYSTIDLGKAQQSWLILFPRPSRYILKLQGWMMLKDDILGNIVLGPRLIPILTKNRLDNLEKNCPEVDESEPEHNVYWVKVVSRLPSFLEYVSRWIGIGGKKELWDYRDFHADQIRTRYFETVPTKAQVQPCLADPGVVDYLRGVSGDCKLYMVIGTKIANSLSYTAEYDISDAGRIWYTMAAARPSLIGYELLEIEVNRAGEVEKLNRVYPDPASAFPPLRSFVPPTPETEKSEVAVTDSD